MNRRQTIPKELRFTLEDFNRRFPDDEACLEFLKEKRWPGGVAFCAKCEQDRKHHRVTGRPAYACDYCGSMISPSAGTIFERSSTHLRDWFYAVFRASTAHGGFTAKQLQRETGVTYKTAWRMMSRIRELLAACIAPAPGAQSTRSRGTAPLPTRPELQLVFLFRNFPQPAARDLPAVDAAPTPQPPRHDPSTDQPEEEPQITSD